MWQQLVVARKRIYWLACGPYFGGPSLFYFFNGCTCYAYPTHGPFGKDRTDHKKGVRNPGGQIYLLPSDITCTSNRAERRYSHI